MCVDTRIQRSACVYFARVRNKRVCIQATESIKEAAEISLWHVNEIAYGA